jgi:hypothetical protein
MLVLFVDDAQSPYFTITDQRTKNGLKYSGRFYRVGVPGVGLFEGPIHDSGMFVYGNKDGPSSYAFIDLFSAGPEQVFEYRCGNLVPGIMKSHRFIPELGGTVITLEGYVLNDNRERIYNLPGSLVRKKDVGSRKESGKKLPAGEELPRPTPSNDIFVFQQDLSQKFLLKVANATFYGTLNEHGEFVPDAQHYIVQGKLAPQQIGELLIREDDEGDVYEFRSGRLIPGKLKDGYFRPEVGKKVIPFEDYRYSEKGIQIYNLPGKFIKKPQKP